MSSKGLDFLPKLNRRLGRQDDFRFHQGHTFSILLPTFVNDGMAHFMSLFLLRPTHEYPICLCVKEVNFLPLRQFCGLFQLLDHFFVRLFLCFANLLHNISYGRMTNADSCPLLEDPGDFTKGGFSSHFSHFHIHKGTSPVICFKSYPLIEGIMGLPFRIIHQSMAESHHTKSKLYVPFIASFNRPALALFLLDDDMIHRCKKAPPPCG